MHWGGTAEAQGPGGGELPLRLKQFARLPCRRSTLLSRRLMARSYSVHRKEKLKLNSGQKRHPKRVAILSRWRSKDTMTISFGTASFPDSLFRVEILQAQVRAVRQ